MKKIRWSVWLLFFLVFLLTLLIRAPASLLSPLLEGMSQGRLVLANASGTVWSGSAIPAMRQRSGHLLALERLHWEVLWMPVLTGKMAVQLFWDNVPQQKPVLVTVALGQTEIQNLLIPAHAGLLGELSPMLQPVQLGGQIQLRSELMTVTRQGIRGSAVAEWQNAASVLSSIKPLGNYRINLAAEGERLEIELMTTSGVLLLQGKGSFGQGQGLVFQGTARAEESNRQKLAELLNNFGPESAPGVHTLSLMR